MRVTSCTEIWIAASRMRNASLWVTCFCACPPSMKGSLRFGVSVMSASKREYHFRGMSGTNGAGELRDAQMQARLRRAEIGNLVGDGVERLRCGADDAANDRCTGQN